MNGMINADGKVEGEGEGEADVENNVKQRACSHEKR
jgi:hypothetical protein